jgi:hypothetical protein
VALTVSSGAEQARALLVRLVLAIRDGSDTAIEALLAERVIHAQGGLGRTTYARGALAHQLIAAASVSHVDADTPFEALVDPATIQVIDAHTHFAGTFPAGIDPSDEVILFAPTALGRRLLAGLASTALVVRPGPAPVVIAR